MKDENYKRMSRNMYYDLFQYKVLEYTLGNVILYIFQCRFHVHTIAIYPVCWCYIIQTTQGGLGKSPSTSKAVSGKEATIQTQCRLY